MTRSCSFQNCTKSGIATLGSCDYCPVHFISTCYRYLEEAPELMLGHQEHERKAEAKKPLLIEIVDQVTLLSLTISDFTNQERGQLLDILLWASDLLQDKQNKRGGRSDANFTKSR